MLVWMDGDGGVREFILLDVEVVLPIWDLAVQEVCSECEDRTAEEDQSDGEADGFDDPIALYKCHHQRDGCECTGKPQTRGDEVEWRCGREQTATTVSNSYTDQRCGLTWQTVHIHR